ncbi:MAG: hypothetical protein FP825_16035 [Hyphomonas sp.]|uniref:hypothetical protein n=1 Tax=Hyphomonas sp. TaxID=87 RepID=UPI00180E12C1|nr:hypothetical protein [Hyphomonas sp.]MBA3069981.1 hypothetical protein [Hyphomonas sp.]MBU3919207.1 hypothetical protein [Alphaproteobacteria bacterium]MBU4060443.1 hypothetical protein [Alphaproteobacteria bacterium]MBU4163111.1 hypothetical protein [Alphaproteobacteria bacterium]
MQPDGRVNSVLSFVGITTTRPDFAESGQRAAAKAHLLSPPEMTLDMLATKHFNMVWKVTALGSICLALIGIVGLWLYSSQPTQSIRAETHQAAGDEPLDVPDETLGPPKLPVPGLLFEPICDHCAHNSCAPEPPTPLYPGMAMPIAADCEAEFYVNERGEPFDISVSCTNEAFVSATEEAIAEMRWPTTDMYGEVCRHIGQTDYPIRYPFQYRPE